MVIIRPDAIEVLGDARARRSLRRYFDVLDGKKLPRHIICRSILVDVSLDEPDEVLWEEHDRALKEFEKNEDRGSAEVTGGNSLLDLKVELANRLYRRCIFCERRCMVDRTAKHGVCGVQAARISSMFHHYGEEPELVPSYTVFFSGCNFRCQFCQNYDISQRITGYELSPADLSGKLEAVEARNINWVGGEPTPNLNFILDVLRRYNGVMPSVWNSNMYMSEEAMSLLRGTQDLFLTDLKYGNDECAKRLSKVDNYTEIVKRNHELAREQAELIVRHLVLPGHLECCTREVARFVAEELGRETRFNLMFQYRPMYRAHRHPEINRVLTGGEVSRAWEIVREAGLENVIS